MAGEVDIADPVPGPAQHRVEHAQRLGGDVLEDEDSGHGRSIPDRFCAPVPAAILRGAPVPLSVRVDVKYVSPKATDPQAKR
jgi:hypothetical protein